MQLGNQRFPHALYCMSLLAVCLQVWRGDHQSCRVSGWFSELTTGGQGWIAVGLVIFAQWDPIRAAVGSYAFGALRRLILDIQGPILLLGLKPVLLQSLPRILPANAPVCLYGRRAW